MVLHLFFGHLGLFRFVAFFRFLDEVLLAFLAIFLATFHLFLHHAFELLLASLLTSLLFDALLEMVLHLLLVFSARLFSFTVHSNASVEHDLFHAFLVVFTSFHGSHEGIFVFIRHLGLFRFVAAFRFL